MRFSRNRTNVTKSCRSYRTRPKSNRMSPRAHNWPRGRYIYFVSTSERLSLHFQHQCFGGTSKLNAGSANVANWPKVQHKGDITVQCCHTHSVTSQLQCKNHTYEPGTVRQCCKTFLQPLKTHYRAADTINRNHTL